jgi:hypothetical protein
MDEQKKIGLIAAAVVIVLLLIVFMRSRSTTATTTVAQPYALTPGTSGATDQAAVAERLGLATAASQAFSNILSFQAHTVDAASANALGQQQIAEQSHAIDVAGQAAQATAGAQIASSADTKQVALAQQANALTLGLGAQTVQQQIATLQSNSTLANLQNQLAIQAANVAAAQNGATARATLQAQAQQAIANQQANSSIWNGIFSTLNGVIPQLPSIWDSIFGGGNPNTGTTNPQTNIPNAPIGVIDASGLYGNAGTIYTDPSGTSTFPLLP